MDISIWWRNFGVVFLKPPPPHYQEKINLSTLQIKELLIPGGKDPFSCSDWPEVHQKETQQSSFWHRIHDSSLLSTGCCRSVSDGNAWERKFSRSSLDRLTDIGDILLFDKTDKKKRDQHSQRAVKNNNTILGHNWQPSWTPGSVSAPKCRTWCHIRTCPFQVDREWSSEPALYHSLLPASYLRERNTDTALRVSWTLST